MEIKYTTSDPELANLLKNVGISCDIVSPTEDLSAEGRDIEALSNIIPSVNDRDIDFRKSTSDLALYKAAIEAGLSIEWVGNHEDIEDLEV